MRWRFENNIYGVGKLIGVLALALIAFWLIGLVLRGVAGLLLGLVALVTALLKFLLLAAVVVGVGYLVARALKAAQARGTLENAPQPVPTEPQSTTYVKSDARGPQP